MIKLNRTQKRKLKEIKKDFENYKPITIKEAGILISDVFAGVVSFRKVMNSYFHTIRTFNNLNSKKIKGGYHAIQKRTCVEVTKSR